MFHRVWAVEYVHSKGRDGSTFYRRHQALRFARDILSRNYRNCTVELVTLTLTDTWRIERERLQWAIQ